MENVFSVIGMLAIGALIPIIVGGIATAIARYLKKRIKVQSPEASKLDQVIPILNAIADLISSLSEGVITLLEVYHEAGLGNGNITSTLKDVSEGKQKFDKFLLQSAKIKVPAEEK